jgi:hypothetical protein
LGDYHPSRSSISNYLLQNPQLVFLDDYLDKISKMPTYEYYCETNGQTVEVLHGMGSTLSSWGELCIVAGIDTGETPENTPVERMLSAVSLLPKKGEGGNSTGGCCGGGGGGCGCGGHQ